MRCENLYVSVGIDTYGAHICAVFKYYDEKQTPDLCQEGMRIY